jgi:hypothetical protein
VQELESKVLMFDVQELSELPAIIDCKCSIAGSGRCFNKPIGFLPTWALPISISGGRDNDLLGQKTVPDRLPHVGDDLG